ncbi:helix-turn-helix transcriptional regulator [Maricaulis sp.]|uniref:S24 family peptidase n=1 Tax=Maricaulis sp. TaxID=1486257 RepID=UPI0026116BFB|nr:helix-turn-helix transcriptional regulator [Maricaulis sp.]
MFTHAEIWRGIDRLAAYAETSPSGLARRAGLDATTFNPSKRTSADGSKPRWPSTESLSKALAAANLDFLGFAALVRDRASRPGALRSLDLAEAGNGTAFGSDGLPEGSGWSYVPFPDFPLKSAFALKVPDDRLAPVYRAGDRLVIDRAQAVRPGDRVMVETRTGGLTAHILHEQTVQQVWLKPLGEDGPLQRIALDQVTWMARIIWASQ